MRPDSSCARVYPTNIHSHDKYKLAVDYELYRLDISVCGKFDVSTLHIKSVIACLICQVFLALYAVERQNTGQGFTAVETTNAMIQRKLRQHFGVEVSKRTIQNHLKKLQREELIHQRTKRNGNKKVIEFSTTLLALAKNKTKPKLRVVEPETFTFDDLPPTPTHKNVHVQPLHPEKKSRVTSNQDPNLYVLKLTNNARDDIERATPPTPNPPPPAPRKQPSAREKNFKNKPSFEKQLKFAARSNRSIKSQITWAILEALEESNYNALDQICLLARALIEVHRPYWQGPSGLDWENTAKIWPDISFEVRKNLARVDLIPLLAQRVESTPNLLDTLLTDLTKEKRTQPEPQNDPKHRYKVALTEIETRLKTGQITEEKARELLQMEEQLYNKRRYLQQNEL